MIYFNKDKFQQITNILSIPEHYKEANDVLSIFNAILEVKIYGLQKNAIELDNKLRQEYPIIEIMLNIANSMPKVKIYGKRISTINEDLPIIQKLMQDYYGICADVLLKEKIIHSIEDFIDHVEE